jgi:hypothetical protein
MLFANIGVPLVCVSVPIMLLALLPIAWVEALVYRSALGLSRKDAFWGSFSANLWSTLVGIPMIWFPLLIAQIAIGGDRAWGMATLRQRVEAVTLQAPWLIPYQDHIDWMVPAASLVLLFPFYIGTVIVEYWILAKRWQNLPQKPTMRIVMLANALSYFGLALFYGGQLWLQAAPPPLD